MRWALAGQAPLRRPRSSPRAITTLRFTAMKPVAPSFSVLRCAGSATAHGSDSEMG